MCVVKQNGYSVLMQWCCAGGVWRLKHRPQKRQCMIPSTRLTKRLEKAISVTCQNSMRAPPTHPSSQRTQTQIYNILLVLKKQARLSFLQALVYSWGRLR